MIHDIRYAIRGLAKRPLLLAAAIASIAIGAGLNLGVYSVLRRVMFDAVVTAAAPERLVRIGPGVSLPNYRDLQAADVPIDPVAFAVAPLLLLVTGLVSSMRPARRAAAAEPIVALRSE